ncbi:phosphotransferase [Ferribacterium limneticum]|uniref:phosphotransferase n=1 Tax=Ferribacterium limneticum TaxID=76259 RepID=UPI001CF92558|nr:phosphotransferase [Ferribacterium limneticum]UCV23681.1 DUF1679 domain-containing protein [Ferribacterium limneticum]
MTTSQLTWKEKAKLFGKAASVGLHVMGEHIYRRKAWNADDVPRSYLDITPEWLSTVMGDGWAGAKVLAIKSTGGSVGTSSRHGLQLSLNAEAKHAGWPDRVFTKATTNYTQRLVLGLSDVIWGEVAFYNHLRKPLDIEAPKGYFACACASSFRSMVVMEDIVHTKGAKFVSADTYITKAQVENLLADMAKLHGHYWNSNALQHDFNFLPTTVDRWKLLSKIGFKGRSLIGAQRAAAVIPAAIVNRQDDLWNAVLLSFSLNMQQPQTLLHGDSHVGQTYITRDGRMGLTDWQAILRGGWAYDFAYLVTSALTVEDRRLWEQDLLHFYLDRLQAAGGAQIPFDEAWLSYRQHTFYPYFAWVYTIGAGTLQPNMQPDHISMAIIERTANAINDHDALKLVGI